VIHVCIPAVIIQWIDPSLCRLWGRRDAWPVKHRKSDYESCSKHSEQQNRYDLPERFLFFLTCAFFLHHSFISPVISPACREAERLMAVHERRRLCMGARERFGGRCDMGRSSPGCHGYSAACAGIRRSKLLPTMKPSSHISQSWPEMTWMRSQSRSGTKYDAM